tara:strand:+ start:3124 stop:3963 length:840 start_codon:yes stop_codon:yes gene_type:complete
MLIEVNSINLYVETYGAEVSAEHTIDTDKPVLIAVPGGPGFSHTFLKPALNPIADYFPLVYFDPRGTGKSDLRDPSCWNLEQLADDLANLISKLGIKNPYIYAHSAGVNVSALLIKKYPSLVKGLVSANGIIVDKQTALDNWIKLGGNAAKRMMVDLDVTAVPEFMETVIPKYDPIPRPLEHAETLEANIEQCLHLIHSFLDMELLKTLENTQTPCHFIVGKHDPLSTKELSIPLLKKANQPNFSWEVFEQSGHDNLLCEPSKTIEVVLDLMRKANIDA